MRPKEGSIFEHSTARRIFPRPINKLMQPVRNANPGIAAYTPPPRTVINYPKVAQFTPNQTATSSQATEVPPTNNADETTGRAIQVEEAAPHTVEQTPPVAPIPAPLEKPPVKRAVAARPHSTVAARPHSTATRERAWVGNYSSARAGPYPGYAAVH
jgi:hypothetical protein